MHGDPVRLKQVLNNLISNALKFTEHGHVDIQVSGFPCASGKEIRLSFAIADSGTGIPADRLDHIFTPFTQADSS
ncbi:MAG: hybrid sensor histidine kinase/response regulator, partial [Rhodoferax sp.]|nr:hybrid sensor histidine kinase/response regulator [Rhodoferax sp.]